ncbi:hypothetical protein NDU88_009858 [Pleurodeles waltl]|uniref:Uncharacterized protein n=1 Tax=Pleurodeles waltl TaxID=8319 RepID=A0AAV7S279_PLEWA|nr:hypothetical protein NDU88_009858 [Pleurodeles waltl]
MARMSQRIDEQAECLDMAERRITDIKDKWAASAKTERQLEKSISALQAKVKELEGHSQWNHLCIISLVESSAIGKMESSVEHLLIELLGCETFSDIFWSRGLIIRWLHGSCRGPALAPPLRDS